MERIPERWKYDVFLSFRGADVRMNFLSHLYKSLKNMGIMTFMDDVELERGEYIPQQLLESIESSKILVVVLSQDFASSAWCLNELVHIMKGRRRSPRQLVFPIFFNVDPSDIRKQRGSYGQSFLEHERRYPLNKVKDWREALTEVANLSGWDMRYRNEAKCIEDITREIFRRLPCRYLHVPSYAVGMGSRLQHISSLLSIGSDDVRVIRISGMGGIGKTTLAKMAFNKFSHLFEGSSFLENFSEYSKKPEGRTHLQHQLLTDILRRNDISFNGLDHAVTATFRSKKVLIVIDDVDDIHQLNSSAIDQNCFGRGSRIIITTGNMHLLRQLRVEESSYSPEELDGDESLELFSWHAFRTSEPPKEFLQLSQKVIAYCAGLPLAVEVLGAFLIDRSVREWESTLELLKRIPDDNIQAKLQISFDALNSVQRDVFLDIACFFIGMDRDYVSCILDGCNLCPDIVLSVLMERCLITVRDNNIMMHDLIRDMGRHIIQNISPKNCGKRSRLWYHDDVISVLTKKSGTDAIEGISLKAKGIDVRHFEVEAFAKMQELRLLQLTYVDLNGSYVNFPKELRWLSWHEFSLEYFPTSFNLSGLVVLDMQNSCLKRLWEAEEHPQVANRLRYLDLSHSAQLTETPDFSYFPNLEKLLLVNCKSLVLVHKSIGVLHRKLVLLNLSSCIELVALPEELYKLKSLESLVLSGCSKLERLDDALGELESLTTLAADYTALKEIPSSINQLKKLKRLSLNGCKGSLSDGVDHTYSENCFLLLPISLNGLSCLSTLSLGYCNLSDELIPKDLGSLSFLEDLDLRGNNFRNLQTDFSGLLNLQVLKLDDCSELQTMSSLPEKMRSFYASNCIMLERTPDLSKCSVLQSLYLTNCMNLSETPGLEKLKTVRVIHMEMCNNIPEAYRERIMEGWAVGGNGGIFIPGTSLPKWVSFKNETHSITFTVPETSNSTLVGFTLWTLYISQQDDVLSAYSPNIILTNHTKGYVWSRNPATDHIRMYQEKHIWQGHFSNEDFFLQTGDQVEVSVDFRDQVTILEIGITLAYREEIPDEELTITEEILDEELTITEEDDELVKEESHSTSEGMERIPERWKYDVFLSFRGADVRMNFLSHLFKSLISWNITTFMDDVELERGEYIPQQLLESIETSKILVVVLSQDFASSAWCLNELVHIMKGRRRTSRQLVFPIFFNVDPSDIRKQRGSYGKLFLEHERRYPLNKVKDWREALTEVANLSGWDMRYRNEAKCIEDITREILRRLPCRYLHVPSYVVGVGSRLQHISSLLSIGSDDVRVIGISGMGGIGKTILAKMAFNKYSHLFEGSSFLENFREYSKKPEGRTHLQHQLLSDILRRNDISFNGLDHAVTETFRSKRVLLVIDDVDDIHQLNSSAIDQNCFGRGSRIIMTTRNIHLLRQLRVEERSYSPEELDGDESIELFSWHAFRTSEPPREFLQLSQKVVAYCAGLPLAVEVLGAFLIDRSVREWESTLELLKHVPDDNIQAKLQISFDALNSVQRDVFLDIACFFIGMDTDYVSCILDGCNLCPDIVLSVLMERCLITVRGNNIMMHDLIRDMGRHIAQNVSPKNCGKRSRLWYPDDVIRVLTKKTGTDAIEGISLKAKGIDVRHFEVEAFAKMQELRLLQLTYVDLNGSYVNFPKELRWLSWHEFSLEYFPTSFNLSGLVVLDMQNSCLKRLWEAEEHPQVANRLRYLDLSHSAHLTETPDFSYFPNLEKLLLINCKSLVLVHKSIGVLHRKLVLLNLSSCIELVALPEELYKLKSLESLVLSGCSKLERLDDALGELESLTTLAADYTALKEIPSSINQLKNLKKLSLNGCKGSLSDGVDHTYSENSFLLLPISLNGLSCLSTLSLGYCNLSDELIPKDLGSLSFLEDLDLRGNHFCNLQTDFASLPNLRELRLSDCSELQSILNLPRSLLSFYAENCISLERTPDLSECLSLDTLHLNDCPKLVETPGIHSSNLLLNVQMERCKLACYTTSEMILKAWVQRNRGCIYLPGYNLPNWVCFKEKMHSFFFTVPGTHNSGPVVGFTLWTRYVGGEDDVHAFPSTITVKNHTRGGTWIHSLGSDPWINSYILTKDFRVETGDRMEVVVDCDDSMNLETGFAVTHNTIVFSDSNLADTQFISGLDVLSYRSSDVHLICNRNKFETEVIHTGCCINEGTGMQSDLYACSIFTDTSRYLENNQPVMGESHLRPRSRRRLGMGLRILLDAIGFLALAAFWKWRTHPSTV